MLTDKDIESVNWKKVDGLIPAVIQDIKTLRVLMLGYMNKEALEKTIEDKNVCFFSRTKSRLWTKGETSGNFLKVKSMTLDCDQDTLLINVEPVGDTCHLGHFTCFSAKARSENLGFINQLSELIQSRKEVFERGLTQNTSGKKSYTAELFEKGTKRMAQKVGEEGVEVAIAAVANDKEELRNESADLLFHLMVLLRENDMSIGDIVDTLAARHT